MSTGVTNEESCVTSVQTGVCPPTGSAKEKRLARMRAYSKLYQKRPDKQKMLKEKRNRYLLKYPERRLLAKIKFRCKAEGIPFDLEYEDIVIPSHCPVLGMPIEVGAGKQEKGVTRKPHFASVDRIDPKLGYVKGNIQVMSLLANQMKNDASPEQLIMFAQWVLSTYSENYKEPQERGD